LCYNSHLCRRCPPESGFFYLVCQYKRKKMALLYLLLSSNIPTFALLFKKCWALLLPYFFIEGYWSACLLCTVLWNNTSYMWVQLSCRNKNGIISFISIVTHGPFHFLGLTCTEQNFITKAGAQRVAADKGIILIAPDTSPSLYFNCIIDNTRTPVHNSIFTVS